MASNAINIRNVPPETATKIKSAAAICGVSMRQFVLDAAMAKARILEIESDGRMKKVRKSNAKELNGKIKKAGC